MQPAAGHSRCMAYCGVEFGVLRFGVLVAGEALVSRFA